MLDPSETKNVKAPIKAAGKGFAEVASKARAKTRAQALSSMAVHFLEAATPMAESIDLQVLKEKYNTSEEDINYYWSVFEFYDKDKSGKIDINELKTIFHYLGQNPTQAQLKELMTKMDVLGEPDDLISFEEFLRYMVSLKMNKTKEQIQEDIRDAFNLFDVDGNGRIDKKELAEILTTFGEKFTERDVDEMFKEFDTDNDGTIDYMEFVKLVTEDCGTNYRAKQFTATKGSTNEETQRTSNSNSKAVISSTSNSNSSSTNIEAKNV